MFLPSLTYIDSCSLLLFPFFPPVVPAVVVINRHFSRPTLMEVVKPKVATPKMEAKKATPKVQPKAAADEDDDQEEEEEEEDEEEARFGGSVGGFFGLNRQQYNFSR